MSGISGEGVLVASLVVAVLLSAGLSWLTGRMFTELRNAFSVKLVLIGILVGFLNVAVLAGGAYCVYLVSAVEHMVDGVWTFIGAVFWFAMIALNFNNGQLNRPVFEDNR